MTSHGIYESRGAIILLSFKSRDVTRFMKNVKLAVQSHANLSLLKHVYIRMGLF